MPMDFEPNRLPGALDQTKRDLAVALKTAVEELIRLETPFETEMLSSLVAPLEFFFSPKVVRANRGFVKGHVPRERIVREFGDPALIFFNDMTTDPKLNPIPKPEEIALAFKNDFETLFQQNPTLVSDKRQELLTLRQRIQGSKAPTDQGQALATELGLKGLEITATAAPPPEMERQMAWDKIRDLLARRPDPIGVAAAIRDRLHARYDAEVCDDL